MLQWKDIRAFLKAEIVTRMKDKPRGLDWLKGLRTSKDGERLGVCMAIDVLSQALAPELFAEILDRVNVKIGDSRVAFAQALEKFIDDRFNCPSKFRTEPGTDGEPYVRVLNMDGLIRYYIAPSYITPTAKPHQWRHLRKEVLRRQRPAVFGRVRSLMEWQTRSHLGATAKGI